MGPEEADLEALYRDRHALFVAAAAAIVGVGAAHDVVQEAFADALRRPRRRRDAPLEAWVWQIVVNRARDVRRRHRVVEVERAEHLEYLAEDRDLALVEMIRGLSPRRRTVIFLRYFADLSTREIAKALNVSPGTVAATLAQARASLRSRLEAEKEGSHGHRR